jgi:hypothetical protein
MGDMGDDIAKSLLLGFLAGMVMACIAAGGEVYLFKTFIWHHPTFDGWLLFVLCSAFFLGAMWRFWVWITNYF